jgi:predicted RNase H-like HicB family nuclease
MTKPTKDLTYFMNLHYSVILLPEEDGSWGAIVPELRGCMGAGDTPQEALEELEANKQVWFESRLQKQWHIPEPTLAVQQRLQQMGELVATP